MIHITINTLLKHASSIWTRTKRHLRASNGEQPEVTRSDANHVTGSHVTGSDRMRMRNQYILYGSGTVVPWLPGVTSSPIVTPRDPEGVPLGVRMRNRKLRNIRTSGAF